MGHSGTSIIQIFNFPTSNPLAQLHLNLLF